jgi:hypothetical protein
MLTGYFDWQKPNTFIVDLSTSFSQWSECQPLHSHRIATG